MQVAGHSEESITQAVQSASARLGDNLDIRQLQRHGKTGKSRYLDVRITVKQTRDKNGHVLPGVHVSRTYGRTRDGMRANHAADWNAHGEFMLELYKINPETVIRAGGISSGGVVLKSREDLRNHWR
jgi:hypothetical protein